MTAAALSSRSGHQFSKAFRTRLPARLKEPGFWLVQGLILAATTTHVALEVTGTSRVLGDLRHLPVTLYVVPIVVAALLYGFEGAIISTLQCSLIAVPSLSFLHHSIWSLELIAVSSIAFVSNLLSWRIDKESRLRKAAEDLASRLASAESDIREYAARLTEAQEEERYHLARELHDSCLQDVLLLVRSLEQLDRTANQHATGADIKRLIELSRSIAHDLRRYSGSLRLPVLDDLGLLAAIESLADELTDRTSIPSTVTLSGQLPDFQREFSLAVYRIIQEALRNVERHSSASSVLVAITAGRAGLEFVVGDDGIGFNPREPRFEGRMGLKGMHERAVLIGASLDIHSTAGYGTKVRLIVPASTKEGDYVG